MTRVQPLEATISSVIARSKGRCECRLQCCSHVGRCTEQIEVDDDAPVVWLALTDEVDDPENWIAACPDCQDTWETMRGHGRGTERQQVQHTA